MSVLAPLFRRLSPPGRQARLSILIFHRVLPRSDSLCPDLPDAARFHSMLRWITAWFNVLPLDAAVHRLGAGTLPERAAAITFDDGYEDNFSVALPLLREHDVPATFFIATGFLDGGRMFNDTVIEAIRGCRRPELDLENLGLGRFPLLTVQDRRAAIDACIGKLKYRPSQDRIALSERIVDCAETKVPADLMMSSQQVRELHRHGMQIGAHTVSHPMLALVAADEARREMAESRDRLRAIVDDDVILFAYPNGKPGDDFRPDHVRLAREIGFEAAVSTQPGVASALSDVMCLPRFTPWERDRVRFGLRLAANLARAPAGDAGQARLDRGDMTVS